MRKNYFILLGLVSLLTFIATIPGLGLVFLVLTFGLGIILMAPLPNVLASLLCAFPLVALWKTRQLRAPLTLAGALLFGWVFIAPPYLAQRGLENDLASRELVTGKPLARSAPIGVDIRRPAQPHADLVYAKNEAKNALFGHEPCFDACERMLLGGDVSWVRVVITNDAYGNDREETHALFIAGDSPTCRKHNPDLDDGVRCVLYAPDHGQTADLTLSFREARLTWKSAKFTPYDPMGERSVTAYQGRDEESPVVFRDVQVFHNAPTGPLVIDTGSLGGGREAGGIVRARERRASAPIDLAGLISDLGLRLAPSRQPLPKTTINRSVGPPPDAHDAARVASLLATGPEGRGTFSNAFQQEINGWQDAIRWKNSMSVAERRIFCATLNDRRIRSLFWEEQVIRKHDIACPEQPDT